MIKALENVVVKLKGNNTILYDLTIHKVPYSVFSNETELIIKVRMEEV